MTEVNHHTRDTALRYLLGELGDSEREEFEEQYFANDELFVELCALEMELVELWLAGELDSAQARAIAARVETDPALQEQALALSALDSALAAEAPSFGPVPAPRSWQRTARYVAAAVAMAALALLLFRARDPGPPASSEIWLAAAERGEARVATVAIDGATNPLRLRFDLESVGPGRYRLAARRSDELAFERPLSVPRGETSAVLQIPAAELAPGRWVFELLAADAPGAPDKAPEPPLAYFELDVRADSPPR